MLNWLRRSRLIQLISKLWAIGLLPILLFFEILLVVLI